MKYLLDANAVIALLNSTESKPAQRIRQQNPGDVGISSIVIYELYYGAFKSKRFEKNAALIDGLRYEVLDFDKEDAREAGAIRAILAEGGVLIGPYDLLIAGQAKARNKILVTHNVSEFERVKGLKLEDWEV
jgi:tRNA(fMet)-specific endonuclease VapC